jgi:hypothetical protein
MNVAAFIEHVDDGLNPIVVKELRQAVKSWAVTVGLLVLLAVQMVATALLLSSRFAEINDEATRGKVGRELFDSLQFGLGACVLYLIPIHAGVRLVLERADGSLELMNISGLSGEAIVIGKLFTALILTLLVSSCCLPFLTFAYLLGGVDFFRFPYLFCVEGVFGVLATQYWLALGAQPISPARKVVGGILGMLLLLTCSGSVIRVAIESTQLLWTNFIALVAGLVSICVIWMVLFAFTVVGLRRQPGPRRWQSPTNKNTLTEGVA